MRKVRNIHRSKKLIKISLEYDEHNKKINSITITGDFFLYPEESLDELEIALIGTNLEKGTIKQTIDKWFLNGSEAFGFDSDSMTDAILGCLDVIKPYKILDIQQNDDDDEKVKI